MKLLQLAAALLVMAHLFMTLPETCYSDNNKPGETTNSDYSDDFSDDPGDDFTDDFSDMEFETPVTGEGVSETDSPGFMSNSPFSLDGHFKVSSSWNIAHDKPAAGETDWRGLSRLRSELFLDLDTDLPSTWKLKISGNAFYDAAYAINDRDDYTDDVLDENEYEVEFRKVYLEGSITDKLDLKSGRQIVVWGKSDNIRVTDVLNPLDLREPGMTDLEDLRLPVCMTKLDYYLGDWGISAIAVHERRFNKQPAYGSDFYPLDTPYPPEEEPGNKLSDTEYGVSVNGIFSGWDISFYYADFYEDTPYLRIESLVPFPEFKLYHADQQMFGTDINIAVKNWLLKTEIAWFDGVRFSDYFDPVMTPVFLSEDYSVTKALLGIEYMGFNNTTISIEGMNSHVNDIDQRAIDGNISENQFQSALRITRTFLNERLECVFLASVYGEKGEDGAIYRITGEYELTDAVLLTGGAVFYNSGDLQVFSGIGDNDRVYADIEYSF